MPIISSLTALLSMDVSSLKKGVDKGVGQIGRLTKKVGSLRLGTLAAGGALTTVLAGGIAAKVAKGTANQIDEIGKLSKTLGITTKDLAVFDLVAGRGGVSLTQFGKASRTLSTGVLDFLTRGTGTAADAFKELGISQKQLKPFANDTVGQLGFVADALNAIPDGARKTALATKLLGGRGAALLPALAEGSKGLAQARTETELFGTALNQGGVAQIEKFNDTLDDVGVAAKGFKQQLVLALGPALLQGAESLRSYLVELIQARGGMAKFASEIAGNVIGVMKNLTIGISEAINSFRIFRAFVTRQDASEIDFINVNEIERKFNRLRGAAGSIAADIAKETAAVQARSQGGGKAGGKFSTLGKNETANIVERLLSSGGRTKTQEDLLKALVETMRQVVTNTAPGNESGGVAVAVAG